MVTTLILLTPSLARDAKAVDDAFDWSLWLIVSPIIAIVVIGALISAVRGKKKPAATPYRSNARD